MAIIFYVWENFLGNFREVPTQYGTYTEGLLGRPQMIHPLFAQTDVDRDLSRLLFSGLLRVDSQGKYLTDLAEDWKVSNDKTTYVVTLKKNLKWSDGSALTLDDVLFTYQQMQASWYTGPFAGVFKDVLIEKGADRQIKFTLKVPSDSFLENMTIGIIPKKIFKDKKPADFVKLVQTWKPVGSGPFLFRQIALQNQKPVLIELQSNIYYTGQKPYLSKLIFRFYDTAADLVSAYEHKEIKGFCAIDPTNLEKLSQVQNLNIYRIPLPSYTGIFFNLGKEQFASKGVRQALAYAVDKAKIVQLAIYGQGREVNSVVLPDTLGYKNVKEYNFNPQKARELLISAGYEQAENGAMLKNNKPFSFALSYLENSITKKIAEILKDDWQKVGLEVSLVALNLSELQAKVLPERAFDVLLFGESFGAYPDYYTFWHSSQIATGFNLSGLEDPDIDVLLEEMRIEGDSRQKSQKLEQFQDYVAENVPAIFLYQPYFLYAVDAEIKGIALDKMYFSSDRFASVTSWYIRTKKEKISAAEAKKSLPTQTPTQTPKKK
jgi:peptide/nickel transport system substrate-binding protein